MQQLNSAWGKSYEIFVLAIVFYPYTQEPVDDGPLAATGGMHLESATGEIQVDEATEYEYPENVTVPMFPASIESTRILSQNKLIIWDYVSTEQHLILSPWSLEFPVNGATSDTILVC